MRGFEPLHELAGFLAPFALIGMISTAVFLAVVLNNQWSRRGLVTLSIAALLCAPTVLNLTGRAIRGGVLGH